MLVSGGVGRLVICPPLSEHHGEHRIALWYYRESERGLMPKRPGHGRQAKKSLRSWHDCSRSAAYCLRCRCRLRTQDDRCPRQLKTPTDLPFVGFGLLESLLVHVRLLDDFLANRRREGRDGDDDLTARDYNSSWSSYGFLKTDERSAIDKKLAHLTHSRQDKELTSYGVRLAHSTPRGTGIEANSPSEHWALPRSSLRRSIQTPRSCSNQLLRRHGNTTSPHLR